MLDRPLSARAGVALLLLGLVGVGGLAAFLLGNDAGPPPRVASPAGPSWAVADRELASYAGDQACAPCHPAVFRAHRRSRHAVTLHPMRPDHLPVRFPDLARFTDAATGLEYALERRGDQYLFRVLAPDGPRSQPVEFAFGSGKTGITLVGRAGNDQYRELRMSYFPARRHWEVTPGQRGPAADPLGAVHDRATSQRCFSCHATVIVASRVPPEPRFRGVGCEACHGPGRRHIEAIQRRQADHPIDNPGRWDGQRVNALCGRCHRTDRELDPLDSFSLTQTQRFQPLGLAKSACFQASAGRLSCVTCHDAHENARTDAAHYEGICLSCHQPTGQRDQRAVISGEFPAKARRERKRERELDVTPGLNPRHPMFVCPINPRAGCITCHMPKREVVRGITMADHWIRVVNSPAAAHTDQSPVVRTQ